MRYRALLLLLFAIVLGALAAFMVNSVVTQQVAQPVNIVPQTGRSTIVAATDLTTGLVLEEVHLRVIDLPEGAYPITSFQTVEEALIGTPVVISQISAGEVVMPIRLSTGILLRGLTTRIPDGSRAVSIPVNEVRGVGGFVLPGDRVDVIHTTSLGRRDGRPVARTLLQNMIVLGVDQRSSEINEEPVVVNVVTLLADPVQAKTLTLAQQVGDLTLFLRNEGDDEQDDSITIALDDLWDYGPEDLFAPPSRSSSGSSSGGSSSSGSSNNSRRVVEVIRGLSVTQEPVAPESATTTTTDDLN